MDSLLYWSWSFHYGPAVGCIVYSSRDGLIILILIISLWSCCWVYSDGMDSTSFSCVDLIWHCCVVCVSSPRADGLFGTMYLQWLYINLIRSAELHASAGSLSVVLLMNSIDDTMYTWCALLSCVLRQAACVSSFFVSGYVMSPADSSVVWRAWRYSLTMAVM